VGDAGLPNLERLNRAGRAIACPWGACHHAGRVPTYDYQCRSCGTVTEVIHSMLEDGPTVCEACGGELRRVLHPTGIIFRGSGFYKTDSRSGTGDKAAAAPSAPNAPGAGSATASSGADGKSDGSGSSSGSSDASAGKPTGSAD